MVGQAVLRECLLAPDVELLATLVGDLAHLDVIAPVPLRLRPPRVVSPLTGGDGYHVVE